MGNHDSRAGGRKGTGATGKQPEKDANRRNTSFRGRATDRHRTILTTGMAGARTRLMGGDWRANNQRQCGGGSAWQVAARIDPHRLCRAAPYFSELRPNNETRSESGYCGRVRDACLRGSRFNASRRQAHGQVGGGGARGDL